TLTAFAAQAREIRMDEERIEGYRHFINKLWNAARFAQMRLKECEAGVTGVASSPAGLALPHRWILSRTNATVRAVRRGLDEYNFNEVASGIYQFIWREFCDWYLEWIKGDLYGEDQAARDQARGVMLQVLEVVLKLLHPIAPFVTEEIWSVLPGERRTIMLEPFPEEQAQWQDQEAEAAMELLMGVISGIRTIRSEADVHPTTKIEATLLCADGAKRELLMQFAAAIQSMARAETLHILENGTVPTDAGHALVQDVEVVVPLRGLIDAEGELAKLVKERQKLEQELQRVQGKLGSAAFLGKAPPEVVAKEQQKLEELQVRLAKNTESTERMQKLR
ncbi:MAG: class I tRNA ligase family protein, partial [Desulfobulbaceae bacterium]